MYPTLEKSVCIHVAYTFEMILLLEKSNRLDTTIKLFEEMKSKGFFLNSSIFTSIVDSLCKVETSDMAMNVYMEMQVVLF